MLRAPGFLIYLMFALLFGCAEEAPERHRTLYIFGTLLEINAYTSDDDAFTDAVERLDRLLQQMHRDWHAWKGEGELIRLNRALARGEHFVMSEQMADLLRLGQTYYRQSDGLFNPAMGRLIAQWGFHSDEPPGGPPPGRGDIEAWVAAAPGMDEVHISERRIAADNHLVSFDLGAYAKGYALNRAIDLLRRHGVSNAIVNAGGDLCVSGQHGARPWRIGIRHPQGSGVIAALELRDGECVMTSGNYERYREFEGVRYSHIIDPRNGYPVAHVASATVIHRHGALADAAATALSVAGPEAWQRIAEQMSLGEVMLVDEAGKVYLTPAMQARIRFESRVPQVIVPPDRLLSSGQGREEDD